MIGYKRLSPRSHPRSRFGLARNRDLFLRMDAALKKTKTQRASCIRYLSTQPTLDAPTCRAILVAFSLSRDTSTSALVRSASLIGAQAHLSALTRAAQLFNGTPPVNAPPGRILSTRRVSSRNELSGGGRSPPPPTHRHTFLFYFILFYFI